MLYDRTLIQIRERSFLDLLDLALYVARARPMVLGLTALVGIAPWAALNYWLLWDPDLPPSLWVVLLIFEAPWATAPLTLVLGDLMFGVPGQTAASWERSLDAVLALGVEHVSTYGLTVEEGTPYARWQAREPAAARAPARRQAGPLPPRARPTGG